MARPSTTYGLSEAKLRQSQARRRLRELGEATPRETFPLEVGVRLAGGERLPLEAEALLRDSVEVAPAIALRFVLWMSAAGATRRGERTWTLQAARGAAEIVLGVCPRGILMAAESLRRGHRTGRQRERELQKLVGELGLAVGELDCRIAEAEVDATPFCAICLDATKVGQLRLRVVTIAGGVVRSGGLLHRWPLEGQIRRPPARPDEAAEVLHDARGAGIAVQDPDRIAGPLEALVRGSVALHEVRGMPGLCDLTEGQNAGRPVRRRRLGCAAGVRVARRREERGEPAMVAARVADMAAMAAARPALDDVLLEPQRRVAGAQLAAGFGVMNTSDVGTGKTTTTLRGQRLAARAEPGFRALVVVPAELCEQWAEEAERFFPEADVVLPEGMRGFARELVRFERATGDRPGLVISGYEQARRGVGELEVLTYSQLVVDEAARLANPETQLSRALWRLRARAALAICLTATPVGRSLEEIDALVAFCFEDRRSLSERRIGRSYAGFDTLSRERLREALGPLMQRVSRGELSGHMPELGEVETLRLSPGPALRELLEACESRIAALYAEVKERAATGAARGSALAAEAQRELARMRGVLLGGVTAARMAKDAESLRGSGGQVARLLEADGLVGRAIAEGSPARRVVAQAIADALQNGEQVLCFSEFTSHLELLGRALRDEHGVEPALYAGPTPKPEREAVKRRFRAGELGCVLVAPLGREGHNLQPASASGLVLHYDLPWEPRAFVQRSGRGARLGSAAERIGVLVPVLRHSIEERVAHLLLPRAAKAVEALARDDERDPLAGQLHGLAAELAADGASTLIEICERILAERANGRRRAVPVEEAPSPGA
ncbi:MAG: hypothetical protein GEU88_05325 [Solirubrobacterales bacterium]|nr:hypothetical protein [Solirubrobacterales bacterium]